MEERLQVYVHGQCLIVGAVVEMPPVVLSEVLFQHVAGAGEEEDAAASWRRRGLQFVPSPEGDEQ